MNVKLKRLVHVRQDANQTQENFAIGVTGTGPAKWVLATILELKTALKMPESPWGKA